jgi:hypothetical protein
LGWPKTACVERSWVSIWAGELRRAPTDDGRRGLMGIDCRTANGQSLPCLV